MAKAEQTPTAVAEQPEQAAPPPQTKEEIAATEQALGLTKPAGNGDKLAKAPVRMGIAPTTIEEAYRMAQFFAASELVPKQYRGRPADVLVAIQFGMEVGLPPASALHSIMVTNGRPSLWGDGFLAVIMASPVYKDHDEYYLVGGQRQEFLVGPELLKDDTTAVCTFWRKDNPRPRTATYSVAKAKKAGLWSKPGPWQEHSDRMLKMRARGFAGRDCFPDVLKGMPTAEEMIDVPPADELEAPKEVRRISEGPIERSATVTPPAAAQTIVVGHVKTVQQFLGGFTIALTNGVVVDTTEAADAGELEKFIDGPNAVRLTCTKAPDGNLQLVTFGIAE